MNTITGNRVYVIDRECYVVYLGKADRKYRPFLRIGTSPRLPSEIRRHISSVVLSDHLTGNVYDEASCLEQPVSRHMHYVGSHSNVQAVKEALHNDQITEQPLTASNPDEDNSGAKVLFYSDGNFRILLDGHRLFDLLEREKADNHQIYMYKRLEHSVQASRTGRSPEDIPDYGFTPLGDGSLLTYRNGKTELFGLTTNTPVEMAKAGVLPADIQGLGGTVERGALLGLVKYLRIQQEPLEILGDGQSPQEVKDTIMRDELGDALEVLLDLDCELNFAPPATFPAGLPAPVPQPDFHISDIQKGPAQSGEVFLNEGDSWQGGILPDITPGLLYRLHESAISADAGVASLETMMGSSGRALLASLNSESSVGDLMKQVESAADLDGISHLAVFAGLWNRAVEEGFLTSEFATLQARIHRLTAETSAPLIIDISPTGYADSTEAKTWAIRFCLPASANRGLITAIEKHNLALGEYASSLTASDFYQAEKTRLLETLGSLMQAREAADAAAMAASAGKPEEQDETDDGDDQINDAVNSEEMQEIFLDEDDTITSSDAMADSSTSTAAPDSHEGQSFESPTHASGSTRFAATSTEGTRMSDTASSSGKTITRGSGGRRLRLWPFAVLILLIAFLLWLFLAGPLATKAPEATTTEPTDSTSSSVNESTEHMAETAAETAESEESADTVESAEAAESTSSETAESAETGEITQSPDSPAPLIFSDGQPWTVLEVLKMANWIAVHSGYARLGEISSDRRNPDWIYPGNIITLPDETEHQVVRGDVIWNLAADFLSRQFAGSGMTLESFRSALSAHDNADPFNISQ